MAFLGSNVMCKWFGWKLPVVLASVVQSSPKFPEALRLNFRRSETCTNQTPLTLSYLKFLEFILDQLFENGNVCLQFFDSKFHWSSTVMCICHIFLYLHLWYIYIYIYIYIYQQTDLIKMFFWSQEMLSLYKFNHYKFHVLNVQLGWGCRIQRILLCWG